MRLAVFEPDIPQNLGAMLRLAACIGVPVDIIAPCGFPFSAEAPLGTPGLRRVVLDYAPLAEIAGHTLWTAFCAARTRTGNGAGRGRLVLLTTAAESTHLGFAFRDDDTLLVGRESSGVPPHVHAAADARLRIPMAPGARSLNVVTAAAIALGEALRQTSGFPVAAGPRTGRPLSPNLRETVP
jgi:tRNA (cytidine/uridine-2'-O-)-methyltransferase